MCHSDLLALVCLFGCLVAGNGANENQSNQSRKTVGCSIPLSCANPHVFAFETLLAQRRAARQACRGPGSGCPWASSTIRLKTWQTASRLAALGEVRRFRARTVVRHQALFEPFLLPSQRRTRVELFSGSYDPRRHLWRHHQWVPARARLGYVGLLPHGGRL